LIDYLLEKAQFRSVSNNIIVLFPLGHLLGIDKGHAVRINTLLLIVFGLLGFLTSCAQTNRIPKDIPEAIQRATTRCDHEALAKNYEDAAREMQSKVKEHKKMLESYGSITFKSGKEGLELQSHCESLINAYEQAVKANMDMANSHRAIAAEKIKDAETDKL